MKRRELLKQLKAIAKTKGVEMTLVREGSSHSLYQVGRYRATVGRHVEIPEMTAQRTLKEAQEDA